MPRGIRTSTRSKKELVTELCMKINCNFDNTIYNPTNGTITKKLLQEVCRYKGYSGYATFSKPQCASTICKSLSIQCDGIDFNDDDDTISAGFIEKILCNI